MMNEIIKDNHNIIMADYRKTDKNPVFSMGLSVFWFVAICAIFYELC